MRRIVIDMQNVLFADAVAEALRNFDSNLEPVMSESPDKTLWWMKTQRKSWRTGCGRPRRMVW